MRADPRGRSALGQIPVDLAGICRALTNVVTGARGGALIDDLRATVGGTTTEIVWQALFADCLRVVHGAVMADGVIEDREIEALYEIIAAAAGHYAAGPSSPYTELAVVDRESARAFLDRYAADRGPFGRGARLRWPGLTLCRRAAELGEREALQRYTAAMTAMSDAACRLARGSEGEPRRGGPGDELDELQRILASETTAMAHGVDRRVQAFLAPCRVFSAVQQASSIFENDPFDVEAVHREARISFEQLVAHATMRPQPSDLGRMLVVLGDSGAGKTHVLRGFRRHVQEGNRGFVVYAQLQSRSGDYSRYLLRHLVDSLSRRYSEQSGRTGLRELAGGLLRLARPPLRERIQRLVDDSWDGRGSLADYVEELVNDLVRIEDLASFDCDLLRVLLYALRPDPPTTSSVYKYLRCDAMNAHDLRWIGNVEAKTRDDDPHWMIHDLARFIAVTGRALVVMVDQVDLAGFEADSTRIFRRAIDALYRIVSECSSAVAVVACLSDLYSAARAELNKPALDRLENAPPIARLQVNRSYTEIEAVVARRLSALFTEYGTVHRPEQPVYPIPETELRQLENRRLRDVLEWCHQFQIQCAAAGKIINADEPVTVEIKDREADLDAIATAWSEATQANDLELPDEEDEILEAVAEAARAYAHEMALALAGQPHKNGVLRLEMSRGEDRAELAISVVNQTFRGGAFTGRIQSLRKRARGAVPIAVRTLEFPRGRACDKAMGQLINMRGRGAYLDAATLRTLVAFQRFLPPFAEDRIAAWKLRDRPISSLPAVIEIFDFDRSRVEPPAGGGRRAASEPGETDGVPEASLEELPSPDIADTAPDIADAAPDSVAEAAVADRADRFTSLPADTTIHTASATISADPPKLAAPGAPRPRSEPGRQGRAHSRSATEAPGPSSTDASAAPSAPAVAVGTKPSNGTHTRAPTGDLDTLPPIPSPQRLGVRESQQAVARPAAAPSRQIQIGNSTSFEPEPILLEPAALLGHLGIIDGNGSARLAAVANLVEQLLERGVPAIVLDRTGELCGYARPDWWQRSDHSTRACRLAERIEVRLFTPGVRGGRPLSVAVIPDLSRVPATEHVRTVRLAAEAVAAMLHSGTAAAEAARLAMLTRAIALLAKRSPPGKLVELIALIASGADEPAGASGDDPVRHGLVEGLAARLGDADVFIPGAEPLTAATLVGPAADGRIPLAIIHTGFLSDGPRLRSWVAQLIGAVHCELAHSATMTLDAVLVIDGAEVVLPAGTGKLTSKDPLQGLLERAGAAGVGVVLASQRPADLDYRRCTSIDTWFVGKTDEPTLERMKALFERRPLGRRNLPRLESGRIVMLRDGGARDVERALPLLRIEPIEEAEVKSLAARSHPRAREPGNHATSVGASAQASAKSATRPQPSSPSAK